MNYTEIKCHWMYSEKTGCPHRLTEAERDYCDKNYLPYLCIGHQGQYKRRKQSDTGTLDKFFSKI